MMQVSNIISLVWRSLLQQILIPLLMPIVEANLVPDFLVRFGIRQLLKASLRESDKGSFELNVAEKLAYVKDLKTRVIAQSTQEANEQHYEVPADFYQTCLGEWRKYSCGYWPGGVSTLTESEEAALHLVCDRAQITNTSMSVLDMGCGWGSATLFIASHFPAVHVTAVSNSNSQREYIEQQAQNRGLTNVTVITADINVFNAEPESFDRVVSIEMMEHVKNYEKLLLKVSTWLKPTGKLFVHIFSHRQFPFHYTDGWMAENFFTGGQMPSDDLLLYFQRDLKIVDHWVLNGNHYHKTCEAWLTKFDRNRDVALKAIEKTYGSHQKMKWLVNWRLFFLACSELFAYNHGEEWGVSHYLFEKPNTSSVATFTTSNINRSSSRNGTSASVMSNSSAAASSPTRAGNGRRYSVTSTPPVYSPSR